MGSHDSDGEDRLGRGPVGDRHAAAALTEDALTEDALRAHWWAAVASVTRMTGDLAIAEDAVQEACLAALTRWPADGEPANPRGWLVGVARHKALDLVRREARRGAKEEAAMRELGVLGAAGEGTGSTVPGGGRAGPGGPGGRERWHSRPRA
jgi:hypothetical protein